VESGADSVIGLDPKPFHEQGFVNGGVVSHRWSVAHCRATAEGSTPNGGVVITALRPGASGSMSGGDLGPERHVRSTDVLYPTVPPGLRPGRQLARPVSRRGGRRPRRRSRHRARRGRGSPSPPRPRTQSPGRAATAAGVAAFRRSVPQRHRLHPPGRSGARRRGRRCQGPDRHRCRAGAQRRAGLRAGGPRRGGSRRAATHAHHHLPGPAGRRGGRGGLRRSGAR
jgi:hypothetical protein